MPTLDEVIETLRQRRDSAYNVVCGTRSPHQSAEFQGEHRAYSHAVQLLEQCKSQGSSTCQMCQDTGLLRTGHGYCDCRMGKRLAEEAMVAGEHGL